jgi:hypothetical protein
VNFNLELRRRGLGSQLPHKSVPAKANPSGEENHLISTAGIIKGVVVPPEELKVRPEEGER